MKPLYIILTILAFNNAYAEGKNDLERLNNLIKSSPQREVLDLPSHDFRSTNLDIDDLLSFKGSNFEKANFSGTLQKPKIITNIDFSNCNLNEADFSYTIITKCKFNNAQGYQANFKGSIIKFSSFHSMFLSDSNFTDTNQESVSFDNANLQCSIWNSANIFRLSFTRSDERGMIKKNIKENHCSHEDAIRTKFMENFQCPVSR